MADSDTRAVSPWGARRRGILQHRPRMRRWGASVLGVTLGATALAACTSSPSGGPTTINFYSFNDPSGAVQTAVTNCSKQSNGKYTITYNKLPAAADDQRLQMARRLATCCR